MHLEPKEKRWFAISTKFRSEKLVVHHLQKKGVEAYIPLVSRVKKYTSKVKSYQVPLINHYVFVHISKDQYVTVLQTEYVFGFVKIGTEIMPIPLTEINLLKKIVGESLHYDVEVVDRPLVIGQSIEIVSGLLTGLKGVLIDRENNKDFIVELVNIGVHLRMKVNQSQMIPCIV